MLDTITSEFEVVHNTQKEMLLFVGIIGMMLLSREVKNLGEALDEEEKVFVESIIELMDRRDLTQIRDQHENAIKIKNISNVLDLGGIQNLIKDTPLFDEGFDLGGMFKMREEQSLDVNPFRIDNNNNPSFKPQKSIINSDMSKIRAARGDCEFPKTPEDWSEKNGSKTNPNNKNMRVIPLMKPEPDINNP